MSGTGHVEDYRGVFTAVPTPCLLLDAELVIADVNGAYLAMVQRHPDELVGRYVFDAFPAAPDSPDGSAQLEASMRRALATGQPDRLPLLEYAVELEGPGRYEERWWSLANVPVLGPEGVAVAVLNVVEDVTDAVRERRRGEVARADAEDQRQRSRVLEADLTARSQALTLLGAAEARATRRLAGLAEAALALAAAETVDDLTAAVVDRGLVALGADGGAIAVRDDERQVVRVAMTDSLGEEGRRIFGELPLDGPLPASVAARTGRAVLLRDRAEGLALVPEMAEVYAAVGRVAWAALPLRVGSRLLGSITISWDAPQAFTAEDVELLGAFAAQCAQTLDRLLVRQAERAAAVATARLSEALQRSLLTDPPQPDHLQIAVRYLPAAQEAQVGGDWYDAFRVQDGATCLVIGDVAGHDRHAAVAMAQVRNVLRGVAHVRVEPPAAVLSALDLAMEDLALGVLATAVLARVEQTDADAERGLRTLRWSNAGHPPPLLVHPGGRAELLARDPDLLLGLQVEVERSDHTQVLHPGATLLLFTDGLVERRGTSLDDGLEWLRRTAERLAGLELEDLCDALLGELQGEVEDDVAVLALRAHAEDRP